MKIRFLCLAGLMLAAISGQVQAGFYQFTYTGTGNTASGTLSTVAYSGTIEHVTGGSMTITSSTTPGAVGTYSLTASGPGVTLSPNGAFNTDNLLYTANDATPSPSYLDSWGLLFTNGTSEEINIWGNGGSSNYSLWGTVGGAYNPAQDNGTFTLTASQAVPEPASLAMWGFGAIGMAFARRRRNRRNSTIAS